jgi:hypothetical protein
MLLKHAALNNRIDATTTMTVRGAQCVTQTKEFQQPHTNRPSYMPGQEEEMFAFASCPFLLLTPSRR